MSVEPEPPAKPVSLAKLATIFACAFCGAFGLCTVGATTGAFGAEKALPAVIGIALVTEAVCLLGLLVVGGMAIFRSFK